MKKFAALIASLLLVVFAVAGCGSDNKQAASSSSSSSSQGKVLKVGATAVPHAEILEVVKPLLAKEGIDLQIVEFSDYVQPNLALNDKELDANFFQHAPYLENFMSEHSDVKLANAGGIHIEPMGIYSKKIKSLNELKDGASIALPNDPTNGGRSLLLLEKAGLIKLNPQAGLKATSQDIVENPKNLKIKELEAAQVPRSLDDVDIAAVNANYAVVAGLSPKTDSILLEDAKSPYACVIVVRSKDKADPVFQKLIKAYQSPEVKAFVEKQYKGAFVAVWK